MEYIEKINENLRRAEENSLIADALLSIVLKQQKKREVKPSLSYFPVVRSGYSNAQMKRGIKR